MVCLTRFVTKHFKKGIVWNAFKQVLKRHYKKALNTCILTTSCVEKVSPGAKFQVRIAQVVGTTVDMYVNTCRFEAKSLAL